MSYHEWHKKSAMVMFIAAIICMWSGYRMTHPVKKEIEA